MLVGTKTQDYWSEDQWHFPIVRSLRPTQKLEGSNPRTKKTVTSHELTATPQSIKPSATHNTVRAKLTATANQPTFAISRQKNKAAPRTGCDENKPGGWSHHNSLRPTKHGHHRHLRQAGGREQNHPSAIFPRSIFPRSSLVATLALRGAGQAMRGINNNNNNDVLMRSAIRDPPPSKAQRDRMFSLQRVLVRRRK